jgi:hypothetical protein
LAAARQITAVALAALAVKLLDDFLDQDGAEPDRARPVYALLALSVATVLAPGLSLSLFLAAYALGMLGELGRPFPSGLSGWQEMAVVTVLGLLLLGWREMLGSLLLMGGVQVGDDLIDWSADRGAGRRSLVARWGLGESLFVLTIAFVLGWCLAPVKTTLVGAVSAGLWWTEQVSARSKRGSPADGVDWGGRRDDDPVHPD